MSGHRMTVRSTGWAVRVPAGDYFLGDPGCTVKISQWIDLLERSDGFRYPVAVLEGREVLAFAVEPADEVMDYADADGGTYEVSCCFLGLMPLALALQESTLRHLGDKGRIVSFAEQTDCTSDGGILSFGSFVIDTTCGVSQVFKRDEAAHNYDVAGLG